MAVPSRDESPARPNGLRLSTLVYDALDAVVSTQVRGGIIERALERAQAPIVPDEHAALLRFVRGPLRLAVTDALGEGHAERVIDEIREALGQRARVGQALQRADESRSGLAPPGATGSEAPVSSAVRPWVGAGGSRARADQQLLADVPLPGQAGADAPLLLLVDDDAGYRGSMARLLGLEGYRIVEAGDAKRALRVCRQQHVDVVITDYQLIETNGLLLAEQIATACAAAPPEVLCVTAQAPPPSATAHVRCVLRKDAGIGVLVAALGEALAVGSTTRDAGR